MNRSHYRYINNYADVDTRVCIYTTYAFYVYKCISMCMRVYIDIDIYTIDMNRYIPHMCVYIDMYHGVYTHRIDVYIYFHKLCR